MLWIERTPAEFTFNIKAYSLLTNHPTRPDSLYKDLATELPPRHWRSAASTATSSPTRSWTRSGSGSATR